ncbi:MAG TPA: sigma-70 family RNA polymerase sigma factor [Candidatus Acidoferrales bacterium]|nr:sigma-70 family RNA polymerase sigma factor [Candidatus Acidoferrales bacterium]
MLSDLPPSELLEACLRQSIPGAWNEFVRRFQPVIASNVTRAARDYGLASPAMVEDLIQDVYVRLCDNNCRILREFHSEKPDGLYAFVKVVSGNAARDSCKAQVALKRGSGKVAALPDRVEKAATPARESATGVERQLLMSEIDEILRRTGAAGTRERDRNVFWLYYLQGFTSQDIASIPALGLTSKGVESLLQRSVRNVRIELVGAGEKGIRTGKSF